MSVQLGAMKSTHHKTMLEPAELSPRQIPPLLPILTVETHNQDSAVGGLGLHAVIRQQTETRIKPRLPKTKRTIFLTPPQLSLQTQGKIDAHQNPFPRLQESENPTVHGVPKPVVSASSIDLHASRTKHHHWDSKTATPLST